MLRVQSDSKRANRGPLSFLRRMPGDLIGSMLSSSGVPIDGMRSVSEADDRKARIALWMNANSGASANIMGSGRPEIKMFMGVRPNENS